MMCPRPYHSNGLIINIAFSSTLYYGEELKKIFFNIIIGPLTVLLRYLLWVEKIH